MANYNNDRWWGSNTQQNRREGTNKWYPNDSNYEYGNRSSYRYSQMDQPSYRWTKPYQSTSNQQYADKWDINSMPYQRHRFLEPPSIVSYPHLKYSDERRTSTPPYSKPHGYNKPKPLLEQRTKFDDDMNVDDQTQFYWNSNYDNFDLDSQDNVREKPKSPEPLLLGSEEERKQKLAMAADRVKKCLENFNNESDNTAVSNANSKLLNKSSQDKNSYQPPPAHSEKSSEAINSNKITSNNSNQGYKNLTPNREMLASDMRPSTPKEKFSVKSDKGVKKSEVPNNKGRVPLVRNNSYDGSKVDSQSSSNLRQASESHDPKINQAVKKSLTSTSISKTQSEENISAANRKKKIQHKPNRPSDASNVSTLVNEQAVLKETLGDQKKINDLKSQILRQLSTMSKTKLADLISNPHSQKFELAMKFLVKDHQNLVSMKQRNIAHAKIRNLNSEIDTPNVNFEESVTLDPTASIDLSNLPQEFVNHLSGLLNLDFSMLDEGGQHYQNDRLEVCPDDLRSLEELAASLEESKRQEEANYKQRHIKQEVSVSNTFDLSRVKTEYNDSSYENIQQYPNYTNENTENVQYDFLNYQNVPFIPTNKHASFLPGVGASFNTHNMPTAAGYENNVQHANYESQNASLNFEANVLDDVPPPPPPPIITEEENFPINFNDKIESFSDMENNHQRWTPSDKTSRKSHLSSDKDDTKRYSQNRESFKSREHKNSESKRLSQEHDSNKFAQQHADVQINSTLNQRKEAEPRNNTQLEIEQSRRSFREVMKTQEENTSEQSRILSKECKESELKNNHKEGIDDSRRQREEVKKPRQEQSKIVSNEGKEIEQRQNYQEEIEGSRKQWADSRKTREEYTNDQSKIMSNERKEIEQKRNYRENVEEQRRQWRETKKIREERSNELSKSLPVERKEMDVKKNRQEDRDELRRQRLEAKKSQEGHGNEQTKVASSSRTEIEPKKNYQGEIEESRRQWREAKKAREEQGNEQPKAVSTEDKESESKKNYQEEIEESRRQWLEARKAREEQADEHTKKTQHEGGVTDESKKIRAGETKKNWHDNKKEDFKHAKKPDSNVNDEKDLHKTVPKGSPLDSLYKSDKTSRYDSRFERNRGKDYKHFSRDSPKNRWQSDAKSKTYNTTDSVFHSKSYVDDSSSVDKVNSDKSKPSENEKVQSKHVNSESGNSTLNEKESVPKVSHHEDFRNNSTRTKDENVERHASQRSDKGALSKQDIPANGCLVNKKKHFENKPRESPIQMFARHQERVSEETREDVGTEPHSKVNGATVETSTCTPDQNVDAAHPKRTPILNDRDVQTEFAKQLDDKIMQTEPPNELDPSEIQMMLQLLERSSQLSPELAQLLKNHFSAHTAEKVILTQDSQVPEVINTEKQTTSQPFISEPVCIDVDVSGSTAIQSLAQISETDHEKLQVNKPIEPEISEDSTQVSSEIESMFLEMLSLDRQMQKLMARKLQLYLKLRVQIPPAMDSSEECDLAAQFDEIPKSTLTQTSSSSLICPPQIIISQQPEQSSHSVVGPVEILSPVCGRDMYSSSRQVSKHPEHFSSHPVYPSTSDLNPCVKVMDTSVVEAVLDAFTTPNSKVKDENIQGDNENLIHSQVMNLKTKSTQTDILGSMLVEGDCILMTDENNSVEIKRQHQRKICLSRSPLNTLNLSTDLKEEDSINDMSGTEKTASKKHRIYATLVQDESDTDSMLHKSDVETSTPLTAPIRKKTTKKTSRNQGKRSRSKLHDLSSEDEQPSKSSKKSSTHPKEKEDTEKKISRFPQTPVSEVSEDKLPSEEKENIRKKKGRPPKKSTLDIPEDMPLSERKEEEDIKKKKDEEDVKKKKEEEDVKKKKEEEDVKKKKEEEDIKKKKEEEDMKKMKEQEDVKKKKDQPRKRTVSEVSEDTPLLEVKAYKRAKFIYDSEKEREESNDSKTSLESKTKSNSSHKSSKQLSQKVIISESDTVSQDTVLTDTDAKNSKEKSKKKKKKNKREKEKAEKDHESKSNGKKGNKKHKKKFVSDIILDSSSSDDENVPKRDINVKNTLDKSDKHTPSSNKSTSSLSSKISSTSSKLNSSFEIKMCSVLVRRLSNETLNKSINSAGKLQSSNETYLKDQNTVVKDESDNESVHSDIKKEDTSVNVAEMSKQSESDSENESVRSDVKKGRKKTLKQTESDNESVHSDVKKDHTSSSVEDTSKQFESDNESIHSNTKKGDTSSIVENASKQSESDSESVHSDAKKGDTSSIVEDVSKQSESDNESVHSDSFKNDTNLIVQDVIKRLDSDNESVCSYDRPNTLKDAKSSHDIDSDHADHLDETSSTKSDEDGDGELQIVESPHSPERVCNQSDVIDNEEQCIEETSQINFVGHEGTILDLKVYGSYLFAASDSGAVYCYSLKTNELEKKLEGHEEGVTCLCIVPSGSESSEGDLLFTGSLDCYIRCFSLKNHELCHQPLCVEHEIICIDHNWGNVYAGTKSGMVAICDIKNKTLTDVIKLCANSILCIKTTKEGPRKVLITASRKSQVSVHDATNGLLLRTMNQKSAHTTYSLTLHSSLVYCGAASGMISVYEFASGEGLHELKAGGGVTCMRIYNDMLLAACYDGNVYVFNMENNSLVATIPGPGKMLLCMDIIKNQLLLGCKEGRKLVSWNLPAILEETFKSGGE